MIIDVLLENAYIYGLAYSLDVVKGQRLTLVVDQMPEGAEVFHSPDNVLGIETNGRNIKVDALQEGKGKVRIMTGVNETVREVLINVVGSVGLPATSLNTSFDPAVPR